MTDNDYYDPPEPNYQKESFLVLKAILQKLSSIEERLDKIENNTKFNSVPLTINET